MSSIHVVRILTLSALGLLFSCLVFTGSYLEAQAGQLEKAPQNRESRVVVWSDARVLPRPDNPKERPFPSSEKTRTRPQYRNSVLWADSRSTAQMANPGKRERDFHVGRPVKIPTIVGNGLERIPEGPHRNGILWTDARSTGKLTYPDRRDFGSGRPTTEIQPRLRNAIFWGDSRTTGTINDPNRQDLRYGKPIRIPPKKVAEFSTEPRRSALPGATTLQVQPKHMIFWTDARSTVRMANPEDRDPRLGKPIKIPAKKVARFSVP